MLYRFIGLTFLALFVVFSVTGCAAYSQAPVTGFVSTNVSVPLDVGSGIHKPHLKVGTASVTSFLGLFASGDASIQAACQNGGIQQIHYVDYRVESSLGLFAKYTLYVYGE